MKKLMVLIVLVMGSTLIVSAQSAKRDTPPSKKEVENRMERAKTHLELSDEQFEIWKDVHKKYGEEIKVAMKEKNKVKGEELHEKMGKELEKILNEDQKKKFKEVREKSHKSGKPRGN